MEQIKWLQSGDMSIQYLTSKELLKDPEETYKKYQAAIHTSGWARDLIDLWDETTAMWGEGIYSPKWISTTYTMLDLKQFGVDPSIECYQKSAHLMIDSLWVKYDPKRPYPLDLCICGMLLNIGCYGHLEHPAINEIVDTLLEYHMADGAWNCALNHKPHHSSVHTTINVLEGFYEYCENGYTYRLDEIKEKVALSHEFLLAHHLYKSDKTGEVISKAFTMLSYPPRWKYDILRVLYYFAKIGLPYDERLSDALDILVNKQRKDGAWPVQQKYSGLVHFDYEKTGGPSRINTLRALVVLDQYGAFCARA